MAVVPTYGSPKVAPDALPGVRLRSAETPESKGAGLEIARARKHETIAGVFGQTARIASSFYADLQREARQQADDVAAMKFTAALSGWNNKRLYDPETGALAVKGEAALGLSEKVLGEFDTFAGEQAAAATTAEQKQIVAKISARDRMQLDLTLQRHTAEQIQVFHADTLNSLLANKSNEAAANMNEPRMVGQAINDSVDALRASAKPMGWGPEVLKQKIEAVQSHAIVGVIYRAIESDKLPAAQAYFDHYGPGTAAEPGLGIISGEQLGKIEAALDKAGTLQSGLTAATDLWTTYGPKDDQAPINLDTMEEHARKQFADDPKALDATLHFLRERKAGVDAARKDREEANTGGLWVAASQGATLAQLRTMPTFLQAPGRLQAQLADYIVSKAEHVANRAAAEEGRAYTAEQRGRAGIEQRGWGTYWEYSDPKTLDATSENVLQAMRPLLGDEHVNRLLSQKRTLSKSEDAVKAATIDDDLFKTTAVSAGLDPYSTGLSAAEKENLGQLKNAVETAIDIEQQQKGKALTRDEKQSVMQSIVDRKVMLDQWFSDPEKIAATVTNADDRKAAYVPTAKIPPAALAQYLNYARSLPGAERLSDADLRRRFSTRIERAYGLRLIGGTRAEIEAALQGKD